MPARKVTLVIAALALIGAIAYFATRDQPSPLRQSLKADPLAAYQPPGGAVVEVREQNEGSTFGKPTRARYSRMFTVPQGDAVAQLEHAAEAARQAGWTVTDVDEDPEPLGALVAIGEKTLASGRAQMAITVYVDDTLLRGEVKSPALKISLEHLG